MRAVDLPDLLINGRKLTPEQAEGLFVEEVTVQIVSAYEPQDWPETMIEHFAEAARDQAIEIQAKARAQHAARIADDLSDAFS